MIDICTVNTRVKQSVGEEQMTESVEYKNLKK